MIIEHVRESFENFLVTIEFYIKSFIATISVVLAVIALSFLGYFIFTSSQTDVDSQAPIYDPVQLVEYQACLENRVSGTMWYWSKANVLSQCVQYAPTMLGP
jgi:hypothetical protein